MAASGRIPLVSSLEQVYSDPATTTTQGPRWNHLIAEFERFFDRKPTHVARAPGRVNLIGEHIDYALFGVFPAAIERDILIACAPRSGTPTGHIVAENVAAKYERQQFRPVRDASGNWYMEIDKTQLRWESYLKAGYYGVLERFFTDGDEMPVSFDLLVTGSIPPGSGLSSSAALVVASTLAFLTMNNKLDQLTKGEVVKMAMENEKRVGVNSGGMDQAASVFSNAQSALYVTFHPRLSAEATPLPVTSPRSVFVCANSLIVADKVVSSKYRYNLRVVETLVAARVLARRLRVDVAKTEKITLKQVVDRFLCIAEGAEVDAATLEKGLVRIIAEADGLKQSDNADNEDSGLLLEEMIELSGLTAKEFHHLYFSWVDVEATRFQLYKRARHVLSEALRVLKFRSICQRRAHAVTSSTQTLLELGQIMNESQESCTRLFECSCPELDDLTRLALEAGAYGSRLTGAGWGGCTVSLVAEDHVENFIRKISTSYPPYRGFTKEELREVIFATQPSNGACVFEVSPNHHAS